MRKRIWVWLILAAISVWSAGITLPDEKLHVVFCNVGQGDATLLIWGRIQMLVDGGPNDEVIGCLEKHVPFYDRRIELVVLTHPQSDHLTGLISVVKRYNVMMFVSGVKDADGDKFKELSELIKAKGIPETVLTTGDKLKWVKSGKDLELETIWPTTAFLAEAERNINVNRLAQVLLVKFGDFEVLLPGDADATVQEAELTTGRVRRAEVLKVPHHGSRTGMTTAWLAAVKPELAVVSVGKNSFGHPAAESLQMLEAVGAEIRRTDMDGEVEVISDGSRWWIAGSD